MADAGRTRELITPEGVDLRLQLGEATERAAALLIDVGIMVAILIAVTITSCYAALGAGAAKNDAAAQAVTVVWLLIFFVLRNAYFILFELGPRAATPGKRALGLRVAARNGGRLTSDMVFARNFMRELEIFLPLGFVFASGQGVDGWLKLFGVVWSAIFLFFPLFNRDRMRVGDVVAGTWVVKNAEAQAVARPRGRGRIAPRRLRLHPGPARRLWRLRRLQVLEDVTAPARPSRP